MLKWNSRFASLRGGSERRGGRLEIRQVPRGATGDSSRLADVISFEGFQGFRELAPRKHVFDSLIQTFVLRWCVNSQLQLTTLTAIENEPSMSTPILIEVTSDCVAGTEGKRSHSR